MQKLQLLLIILVLLPIITVVGQGDLGTSSEWWNERVFYEIFIRSFKDSDGDGIGDIQGIIEELDYLNDGDPNTTDDLGVTGIWLMPPAESPSYHGYDPSDYRKIDEEYGTNEDFKELVAEAEKRGIAIIVDFVINHSSNEHPWFIKSRLGDSQYADWYIWENEDPGYRGPWGAVTWHKSAGRYYYGVFNFTQPDLNFENPEVTQEIYDIADFWLEELGVAGFRLDAVKHIVEEGEAQENTASNRQWLIDFEAHIHENYPSALSVGEFFGSPTFLLAGFIEEDVVDIAFDFDIAHAIVSSASSRMTRDVSRKFEIAIREYPEGQYATFLSNHDEPRVISQLTGDIDRNKVAATILMTGPGVPFVYYGEEIGMLGEKPDPRIRTPMQWNNTPITAGFTTANEPWEPLSDESDIINVGNQIDDPDSLLSHYRNMIHLRNQNPALLNGKSIVLESESRRVYSILRYTDEEAILVVVNLDDDPHDDYALTLEEGPFREAFSETEWVYGEGDLSVPELNEEGGFDEYLPLPALEPYSAYIFKLG